MDHDTRRGENGNQELGYQSLSVMQTPFLLLSMLVVILFGLILWVLAFFSLHCILECSIPCFNLPRMSSHFLTQKNFRRIKA